MKNFHFGENLSMISNYRGYIPDAMAKDLSMKQGIYPKMEYSNDQSTIEMIDKQMVILSFRPNGLFRVVKLISKGNLNLVDYRYRILFRKERGHLIYEKASLKVHYPLGG